MDESLLDGKRVLIVDDEPHIVMALADKLIFEGYDVVTAHNGQEGIDQTKKENPDLVILDVNLPDINGFDVLKEIMNRDNNKYPVIMLTREDSIDSRITGISAGAVDYVTKPVPLGKLSKFLSDNIMYDKSRFEEGITRSRREQVLATMKRLEYW